MQFLSENRLNGCQIFWTVWFLKTECELNFGFLHIPNSALQIQCLLAQAVDAVLHTTSSF